MKKKTKIKLTKVFAVFSLAVVIVGFGVTTTALALIPNWTQQPIFSCFPSESPTEPIPAFIQGLKR